MFTLLCGKCAQNTKCYQNRPSFAEDMTETFCLTLSWTVCSFPFCWRATYRLVRVNRLWKT